jgi:hypothetical protein
LRNVLLKERRLLTVFFNMLITKKKRKFGKMFQIKWNWRDFTWKKVLQRPSSVCVFWTVEDKVACTMTSCIYVHMWFEKCHAYIHMIMHILRYLYVNVLSITTYIRTERGGKRRRKEERANDKTNSKLFKMLVVSEHK